MPISKNNGTLQRDPAHLWVELQRRLLQLRRIAEGRGKIRGSQR